MRVKHLTLQTPMSGCRYRYTLDDLYPMMNALQLRAESYNEWAVAVSEALEAKLSKKRSTCPDRGRRVGCGRATSGGTAATVLPPAHLTRLTPRAGGSNRGTGRPPASQGGPDGGPCTMVLHAGHMAGSRVTFTSLSQKQKYFTFYTEP